VTRYALLLLILSIAGFLRLYRISALPPGLYRDEAMNGSNALEVIETGRFQVFYPENGGREGLYINVASVFIHALGNKAWVLRFPAAIFGVLTVWGLYLLAAELSSVEIGLLAAFFLATSFWHVNFSRMAFRAIGAPLFLTWALYFLLVSIRRLRGGQPWVGIAVLAGVVYGLGFYTYIAYRATALLVAVLLLYGARKTRWLPGLFVASATITTAPLMLYFAGHPGSFLGRASQVSVLHARHPAWELVLNMWRTGRMFFTRGDVNWRHNVAWRAELFWPVAILFVVGVVLGRRKAGGAGDSSTSPRLDLRLVAFGWLAVAAAPAVLSDDGVPHALRAILMVSPVCMLAALGAHRVQGWLAPRVPRGWLGAGILAFLLVLSYEPYHTYFDVWAVNPRVPPAFDAVAVRVAEQINLLPRETPKFVVTRTPMDAQPIMFLTGSYTEKEQEETNIRYGTADSCAKVAVPQPQWKLFCVQETLQ
jgi:4-amino-4-deoxy-L-arabinose transferase-like glycosyltransferase